MEPRGRVSIDRRGDHTTIVIRPGVVWGTVVLALACLAGAAAFIYFIPVRYLIDAFMSRDSGDVVVEWIEVFMGLVAAYFAARMGLRAVAMREVVVARARGLSLHSGLLGLSLPEHFRPEYMRRLCASPEAEVRADAEFTDPWQYVEGRNVAFDYGLHTVRFGLRLNQDEAEQVIEAVRRHLTVPEVPYTLPEATAALGARRRGRGAPPAPRTRLVSAGSDLRILIPAPKHLLLAIACGLALLGACAFLFLPVLLPLLDGHQTGSPEFNPLHLLHLGAFSLAAAVLMLWNLFGKEEIAVDETGRMRIVRHFGLLQPDFAFDLRRVMNFTVSMQPGWAGTTTLGLHGGNICFAYHYLGAAAAKVHRVGIGLPEAEAREVAWLLQERLIAVQGGAPVESPV